MERSTATVVFTDLVGSTELRSRLGEDAADELRRTHDRLIAGAVEANRGRLVKHLGDGVMATFTGASDALSAAVAIQQALERRNRSDSSGGPLEVRIGVSAGDVAFEDEDCFGTPVIEAARLCGAAGGAKILVTEVVRLLTGTAGGHRFAPVGALDLRGLPAPVAAYEVNWEPLGESGVPMPAFLTRTGRIFVGRDEELEHLLRLWKEATAGEWRVALLAGEPGIGKTRLAVELAVRVRESGGVVLAGRCDEDLGVPFQPFVEALRHYVSCAEDRRLGRYAGELTRLLPDLPQFVGPLPEPLRSDPETERYRLFDALASWLADVSAGAPVLLVLDDLHWAAKPTLLLLRHVLRSQEALRLLVLITYRDSDIGRGHPMSDLLAELRRDGGMERIALSGLDATGVAAFIETAAGHSLEDEAEQELPRVVWRETEGNPFFVAEVLRHLLESGAIEQRGGRWVLNAAVDELGIPEGVRDVVGQRLSRLAETTNRVLTAAAVVGPEFETAVVERAAGIGEEEVFAALEEATNARLLVEVSGARFRFAHALVRATLYDELSGPRRVALHRRVAEAIESLHGRALDDHLPALTHHWSLAAAPAADNARAIDYATRAGDRALAQLAHDEAADYYHQALEMLDAAEGLPGDERRLELLIALGEAQRRAGDPAHRETLLKAADLARARGDADAQARAALANCRTGYVSNSGVVDQQRVTALEAALQAVGDVATSFRARLLANLALELVFSGQRERRVALSDQALALARTLDDPATLAHVLLHRFMTINAPSTLPERLADTAELLTLAEDLNDPLVALLSGLQRARVTLEAGDLASARSHSKSAEALAADLGQPVFQWMAMWTRGGQVLLAGRVDEAHRLAAETFEVGKAGGQGDAWIFFAVHSLLVGFEQGRLEEVEPAIADLVARLSAGVPGLVTMLGLIYCETGRLEDARQLFEPLVSRSFELPGDYVWLPLNTLAAEVVRQLGDRSGAAVLYERLAPYPGLFPNMGGVSTGCTDYYLGMLAAVLGRYAHAEEHFRDAADIYERIGAPAHLGRTFVEWARMLLARGEPGDADRARQLLNQALAPARELGLVNVERRAVHLLTETR